MSLKVGDPIAKRKERSDKKRDVHPSVNLDLYDFISRLSYITTRPMKDCGESICIRALKSKPVMEILSKRFRRDLMWDDHILFVGQSAREPYKYPLKDGKRRLTMRFSQPVHEQISDLAYALDSSVSSATAFLLETAIQNAKIVNQFIAFYVERELLDAQRLKQLHAILRFINKNHQYDEKITLADLLNFLKDEFFQASRSFKTTFLEWIDRNKID